MPQPACDCRCCRGLREEREQRISDMEFLSQSVAGKSQECLAAVEDGELMSGSVRHRLHRGTVRLPCALCRLRLCMQLTESAAVGHEEPVPRNCHSCVFIFMPEHTASSGLPALQQCQP